MCDLGNCWKVIKRKKVIDPATVSTDTGLSRVLSTVDLAFLGIGSTLGVGVYVLPGHVAKDNAGPAVIISFILAGIASAFAGLCYAEFGARAPKAGSAYIYSYVTVGELIAYIIGWNLILEYMIGAASVSKGLSLYINKATNNTLKDWFITHTPLGQDVPYISDYFDLLAFIVPVLISVSLAVGVKKSTKFNSLCTAVNLLVVAFVIIAGMFKADLANWKLPVPSNVSVNSTINYGSGGFFPFGFDGVLKGAATCFYGFVGFDCIATTGEEVLNPKKAIPRSIFISLIAILVAYVGTSSAITLMVPYYAQDEEAPIPHAFLDVGWIVPMWIVTVGGLFGLAASLYGAMFPLPRILYAMANDGLIFRFCGKVNPRFNTPLVGTLLSGVLTGALAGFLQLKSLVNMMSIGTLLAYTIVAACVLVLRYSGPSDYTLIRSSSDDDLHSEEVDNRRNESATEDENDEILPSRNENGTFSNVLKQIFNLKKHRVPTRISENLIISEILIFCVLSLVLSIIYVQLNDHLRNAETWAVVLTSVICGLLFLLVVSMALQPSVLRTDIFQVPWVPVLPALSILVNIYLMVMLDIATWYRFGIWMAIGLTIYIISVCKNPKNKPYKSPIPIELQQTNDINHIENGTVKKETFDGKHTNGNLNGTVLSNGTIKKEISVEEKNEKEDKSLVNASLTSTEHDDNDNYEKDVGLMNGNIVKNLEESAIEPETIKNNEEQEYDASVDIVLAELDDAISKATNRKISADTWSNSSDAFVQENVVAIVHCEDVLVSPKTSLSVEPNPTNFDLCNKDFYSPQKLDETTYVIVEEPVVQKAENEDFEMKEIESQFLQTEGNYLEEEIMVPSAPPLNDFSIAYKEVDNFGSNKIEEEDKYANEPYLGDAKINAVNNEIAEYFVPTPPPIENLNLSPNSISSFKFSDKITPMPVIPLPDYDSETLSKNKNNSFGKGLSSLNVDLNYSPKALKPDERFKEKSKPYTSSSESSDSDKEEDDTKPLDNVRSGTEEYTNIKNKLDSILMKQFLGRPPPLKLTKPSNQIDEEIRVQPGGHVPIIAEMKARKIVTDRHEDGGTPVERMASFNKKSIPTVIPKVLSEGDLQKTNLNNSTDVQSVGSNEELKNSEATDENDVEDSAGSREEHLIKPSDLTRKAKTSKSEDTNTSGFKQKLEEIIKTIPRTKIRPITAIPVTNVDLGSKELDEENIQEQSKVDNTSLADRPKIRLANSLQSVRLRKTSNLNFDDDIPEFNETDRENEETNLHQNGQIQNEEDTDTNDASDELKFKHQALMKNTFSSIRLKNAEKLQLGKDESEPDVKNETISQIDKIKDVENNKRKNSEVDRKKHRALLANSLNSIRLRKVDSFKIT